MRHVASGGRWQAYPVHTDPVEPLDIMRESPDKVAIGALLLSFAAVILLLAILLAGPAPA